jgi:hypothetical protein
MEGNTEQNKAEIETFMYNYSCNIVNRSTGVEVSGARPHKQRARA